MAGNLHLAVGSIAGAGTYLLGGDQVAVGLNGLSTNVSGLIADVEADGRGRDRAGDCRRASSRAGTWLDGHPADEDRDD
jgi:hypothetical protein